jgi:hypothetical protein
MLELKYPCLNKKHSVRIKITEYAQHSATLKRKERLTLCSVNCKIKTAPQITIVTYEEPKHSANACILLTEKH